MPPRSETSSEPGGRVAAPGALALVQAFVNTNDREDERDALASPAALGAWLVEHAVVVEVEISGDELARAVTLREALRGLAIRNAGGASDDAPLSTLNQGGPTGRARRPIHGRRHAADIDCPRI